MHELRKQGTLKMRPADASAGSGSGCCATTELLLGVDLPVPPVRLVRGVRTIGIDENLGVLGADVSAVGFLLVLGAVSDCSNWYLVSAHITARKAERERA
jgi:hypothetical protein